MKILILILMLALSKPNITFHKSEYWLLAIDDNKEILSITPIAKKTIKKTIPVYIDRLCVRHVYRNVKHFVLLTSHGELIKVLDRQTTFEEMSDTIKHYIEVFENQPEDP